MGMKTIDEYSIRSSDRVSDLMDALSGIPGNARIVSIEINERNVNHHDIPAGSKTISVIAELEEVESADGAS